jgi:Outer membrane protein beta-barrel domain
LAWYERRRQLRRPFKVAAFAQHIPQKYNLEVRQSVAHRNFVPEANGRLFTLNRSGWTVGGGAEWMFSPGWSVFAEYNYMDFGNGIAGYAALAPLAHRMFLMQD